MGCNINTLLSAAASAGFFSLQENDLKIAILQLLCDGGSSGYPDGTNVFSGLLSQLDPGSGNPPTIVTLQNTFGTTDPPFSYQVGGPGILLISMSVPLNKTLIRVSSVLGTNGTQTLVSYNHTDAGLIQVYFSQAGVLGDFGYQDLAFEIIVFP